MMLGRSSGFSHPGRKRRQNEDAWVCEPPLFAIADGMGGARGGEIASQLAAGALGEDVGAPASLAMPAKGPAGSAGVAGLSGEERVVALIQTANRRVYDRANEDSTVSGMGTTITLALVEDSVVSIGHVGDSRAYLLRDRKLEQVTDDHTLVAELVRNGKLSPEEAEMHPQRSVITRALGTDPDVDVDTFSVDAKPGDLFLLCSDGLSTMIADEAILEIVERSRGDLDSTAKALVSAANQSGGEDNITVVVFEITDESTSQASTETAAMPVIDEPSSEVDEDTLSGIEAPPAVDTMVVPPEEAKAFAIEPEAEPEEPQERFSVRAARLVVALAIIAALAVLVYWLLGQSQ